MLKDAYERLHKDANLKGMYLWQIINYPKEKINELSSLYMHTNSKYITLVRLFGPNFDLPINFATYITLDSKIYTLYQDIIIELKKILAQEEPKYLWEVLNCSEEELDSIKSSYSTSRWHKLFEKLYGVDFQSKPSNIIYNSMKSIDKDD